MDKEIGSIEIGKCADFTVLDKNLEVYMVIKGGNVGYKR
jgi:N-acetylglucosamine-6-phosphate deacetylase